MIKRNMNNCSLKKRVVDDLSFIFCEDILERVYFTILDKNVMCIVSEFFMIVKDNMFVYS